MKEAGRKTITSRPVLVGMFVLAAWIAQLTWLLATGKYSTYLHPRYPLLPSLSVVVLAAMLVWLWSARKVSIPVDEDGTPSADYTGEHHRVLDPLQRYMLLLLPSMVLALMGVQVLTGPAALSSASSFAVRKLASAGAVGPEEAPPPPPSGSYREITALDIYFGKPELLVGRKVKLTGMVAVNPRFPKGMYALARMLITCCAADARPAPVFVKGSPPPTVRPGSWAWVSGVLRLKRVGSRRIYYIEPDSVTPAAPPESPYLY